MKIGVGLFTGQVPPGSGRTFEREYRDYIDLVRLAEDEGLDSAWVSEHHGSADGYLPSLAVILAAFAAVTDRIELGTGVVLAPFHDPLRLAEDLAVVDQLSGGRVICGLGIGWREEEFRAFGIDIRSRGRRLEEMVAILRHAWTGERFDFEGRHFAYEAVAVTPTPARTPPILIGGFSEAAVRRAGRIGDGFLSARNDVDRVAQSFALVTEERRAAGLDGPPIVGMLHNAFVSENPERDWAAVKGGIAHQLGVYAGWAAGTDTPGTPLQVMAPDDSVIRSRTAFGTPDEIVEHLAGYAGVLDDFPESHLVCRIHYPGMDAGPAARALKLFAREVAPRLRDRARAQ